MLSYHIVQIGCGIVGKAYVDAYKSKGCKVTGIEASYNLINKYKNEMKIYHKDDNLNVISDVDIIMISVCTPLKKDKLDLSFLFSTINNVITILKNSPQAYVVIRSTVSPNTTLIYKNRLELLFGNSVNIFFQPEFLRAVSARDDALNPWHIVIGSNTNDYLKLIKLYNAFTDVRNISIMSIEEAELLKIFHNCYNAAKISFFNQCGLLCNSINNEHKTNIDVNTITNTLSKTCEGLINPQYGTKPGHAYYGTCLPKDSAELASLEKEYNMESSLFENVVKVNNIMKRHDVKEVLAGDFHMNNDLLYLYIKK